MGAASDEPVRTRVRAGPAFQFEFGDYTHDDERDPDALREARIRELQRRGGAVPDPPHSALGPPADDPYRDNFVWNRRRR